jgi:hypothetical protein
MLHCFQCNHLIKFSNKLCKCDMVFNGRELDLIIKLSKNCLCKCYMVFNAREVDLTPSSQNVYANVIWCSMQGRLISSSSQNVFIRRRAPLEIFISLCKCYIGFNDVRELDLIKFSKCANVTLFLT